MPIAELLSAYVSVSGCTNPDYCNYNPLATEDDGSCEYADENYDCDGNCVVEIDCAGECGGSAEVDVFGICEGYSTTIQGAIDAADSSGTVNVPFGTYTECISLNKSITLIADGNVIIDGSACTSVISVNSAGVTVDGFDVVGSDQTTTGINIGPGSTDVHIQNNTIHGMMLPNQSNISPGSYGILVWGGQETSGITLENNEIYDVLLFGIDVTEFVNDITISDNYIHDLQHLVGSFNDLVDILLSFDPDLIFDEEWWAGTSGLDLDEEYWISVGVFSQANFSIAVTGNSFENVNIGTLFAIGDGEATENNYGSVVPMPHVSIYFTENENGNYGNSIDNDLESCFVTTPSIDFEDCGINLDVLPEGIPLLPLSSMAYLNLPTEEINTYFNAFESLYEALESDEIDCIDGEITSNCSVQDCADEWGGSAEFGECGVCGSDDPVVGLTCDGIPINFEYNQSSSQAFYYIHETIDLLGDPLTAEDWVATFNGEICVGSNQWDTSQCNSGICDVPAMGDDGFTPGTENYLQPGDFPSFKIYDYSEGEYFNVYPSENYPFEENAIFNIDELVIDLSYSIPLPQYSNLVSFYVLTEDNSVSNVMLDIQENFSYVIGESESAQLVGDDWTGSLTSLDLSSGYWLNLTDSDTLDGIGHPLNPDRVYNLHSGANLVSFPSPGSVGISAGLPNDIEDKVIAIIGEGFSSINTENGWLGSVLNFEALHGYWIITNEAISFSYELDSLEILSRSINLYKTAEKPLGFDFIQSSQQAFYFVDNVELIEGEIEKGDWIISYCGNMVTGSRLWLGRTVDIPVMGAEGSPVTAGYCAANDTPNFKLYKSGSQELIALHAEIPRW